MSISFEYLAEPKLQFGSYFEHEDTKTGLAHYGPFGKCIAGLHPPAIKLGFIGTRETIAGARERVQECETEIESENKKIIRGKTPTASESLFAAGLLEEAAGEQEPVVRLYKILNRDFVGFSASSPFTCSFQLNDRWEKALQPHEINAILERPDKQARIWGLVEVIEDRVRTLAQNKPSPDIIILALTPEMVEQAHAVQISGNFYLNLRRAIKARSMRWGIPLQLVQRSTILGNKSGRRAGPLQEKASRAWNFCTALYYKADGVPWRPTSLQPDTCFIGISFYVAQDIDEKVTMRASVAQAFDYLGQGLVLRGDPFNWDEDTQGRSPHMPREAARALMRRTLEEYTKARRTPPARVVVHKTSRYWGSDHGDYDELAGLSAGIQEVFPRCEMEFVAVAQTGLRLFREGMYPPLRGTYFSVNDELHFLYTMGFVPYLETFPGSYVPEPWQLIEHHGGTGPKELFKEMLELTKMNVNNCSFADGSPITISFAHRVGEIMKHLPAGSEQWMQTGYKFYM